MKNNFTNVYDRLIYGFTHMDLRIWMKTAELKSSAVFIHMRKSVHVRGKIFTPWQSLHVAKIVLKPLFMDTYTQKQG